MVLVFAEPKEAQDDKSKPIFSHSKKSSSSTPAIPSIPSIPGVRSRYTSAANTIVAAANILIKANHQAPQQQAKTNSQNQ